MNNQSLDRVREKILNFLHKTEGDDEFLKKHLNPPNRCDMDLASPRCATRVKGIEKIFNSELQNLRQELAREIEEAIEKARIDGMFTEWNGLDLMDINQAKTDVLAIIKGEK